MKPDDLPDMTVKKLRDLATAKGVAKAAKLTKSELIAALKLRLKPATRSTKAAAKSATKPAAKAPAKAIVKRTQKKTSFTADSSTSSAKPVTRRTLKKASFTAPRSRRAPARASARALKMPTTPAVAPTSVVRQAPKAAPAKGPNPGLPVPDHYGRDRLVLMVQDPHHLFAYWELTPESLDRARSAAGGAGTPVLAISAGGTTEFREVDLRGGNYYLAVAPNRDYTAELALRDPQGRLHVLARSNKVMTPAPGVSSRVDEQWMGIDETFHELLELAGLPGGTGSGAGSAARLSDQRLAAWNWQKSGVSTLSSASLSSTALSSGARLKPAKPTHKT